MLQKTPFGYSRKDVILIGLGVTFLGIGLKSGLEVHLAKTMCLMFSLLLLVLVLGWNGYHIK